MYRESDEARSAKVAAIRRRHQELLALPLPCFERWCRRVANLREDSVHGLGPFLLRHRPAARLADIDPRHAAYTAAERAAVDARTREELYVLLQEHRLTREQAEYWARTRPWELPNPPPWIVPTLVDEVDRSSSR